MGFLNSIFKSKKNPFLKKSNRDSQTISSQIQHSAATLSAAANEQAAAVQETVASIAEMRSMLNQTGEEVQKSLDIASAAIILGNDGTRSVMTLNEAMRSIGDTKTQLHEIRNIFKAIELKTKVINDIVLKTQILSFNASIEAARAGQFGKGFAVVADQVGRLAQTSGKAAKEIDILLKSSNSAVDSVVEAVLSRVEVATTTSEKVYQKSTALAQAVNKISESLMQVGRASNEQLQGIDQTAKALEQIDITTNENRVSAEKLAQIAFEAQNLYIAETENTSSQNTVAEPASRAATIPAGATSIAASEIQCLIDSLENVNVPGSTPTGSTKLNLKLINANDDSFKPHK